MAPAFGIPNIVRAGPAFFGRAGAVGDAAAPPVGGAATGTACIPSIVRAAGFFPGLGRADDGAAAGVGAALGFKRFALGIPIIVRAGARFFTGGFGAGAGAAEAGGAAGAAVSVVPHCPQKRTPGWCGAPQPGQVEFALMRSEMYRVAPSLSRISIHILDACATPPGDERGAE